MTQPTGTDATVTFNEYKTYSFSEADFGFQDLDGNALLGIEIYSPEKGLFFDGVAVEQGQFIAAEDLHLLTVKKQDWGTRFGFYFKVVDDSDAPDDTAQYSNRIDYHVLDLVEIFRGTREGERLDGTGGRDVLDGRGGNDKLYGNGWKDTFIFSTGYGKDVIVDASFTSTRKYNVVDLSELDSIHSYNDLMRNHVSEHIKDIWIDGGDGDVLILRNTDIHDLDRNEFIF
jgi:hypothetical protein